MCILFGSIVSGRFTFYCALQQQVFFFVSVVGLFLSTLLTVLFVARPAIRTVSFFLYVFFCFAMPLFYQMALKYGTEDPNADVPPVPFTARSRGRS